MIFAHYLISLYYRLTRRSRNHLLLIIGIKEQVFTASPNKVSEEHGEVVEIAPRFQAIAIGLSHQFPQDI
jgi:hypothetical protein